MRILTVKTAGDEQQITFRNGVMYVLTPIQDIQVGDEFVYLGIATAIIYAQNGYYWYRFVDVERLEAQ